MGPVPNAPTAAPSLAPAHCPQFTSAGGADFRGAELICTGLQLHQGTANTRPGWEQGDSPTGPRHSGVRISRAPTHRGCLAGHWDSWERVSGLSPLIEENLTGPQRNPAGRSGVLTGLHWFESRSQLRACRQDCVGHQKKPSPGHSHPHSPPPTSSSLTGLCDHPETQSLIPGHC